MTVAAQQNSFLRNVSCGERKCLSHSGTSDSSEAHNEPSSRCKSCVCVFPFNGDQPNLACMATVELRKKIRFICANRSFEGISAQYQPPQSGLLAAPTAQHFAKQASLVHAVNTYSVMLQQLEENSNRRLAQADNRSTIGRVCLWLRKKI